MSARKKESKFATQLQTRRWVKCMNDWAVLNKKTQNEICELIKREHRVSWKHLRDGRTKKIHLNVLRSTVKECGLDANYINGLYNYKAVTCENRNIFYDFTTLYSEQVMRGNLYQAYQIVRKAALFIFEALVPKDINILLQIENKRNEYDSARIICSADDIVYYYISLYGGPTCVQYTLSKKTGDVEIPVMEGDLDVHALSSIKFQLTNIRKQGINVIKDSSRFDFHAKRITDKNYAK